MTATQRYSVAVFQFSMRLFGFALAVVAVGELVAAFSYLSEERKGNVPKRS
jgi:hypothetical protein